MIREEMDRLIDQHIQAEKSGNPAACVAMHTEDVVHDVVGWPQGPLNGRKAAQRFYEQLVKDIKTEEMKPIRSYYGTDFAVTEHLWTGEVPGNFLGVPGQGKRISFRLLHVWEFRDGRISRENAWLDTGAAIAQLTAP